MYRSCRDRHPTVEESAKIGRKRLNTRLGLARPDGLPNRLESACTEEGGKPLFMFMVPNYFRAAENESITKAIN